MKGVKIGGRVVPKPPDEAPPQQWLDFAALLGAMSVSLHIGGDFSAPIVAAYLARWPEPKEVE